jgi:hypothetical protein
VGESAWKRIKAVLMKNRMSEEVRLPGLESEQKRKDAVLQQIVDDYDRRRSTRWGRFLLWLLRKTT